MWLTIPSKPSIHAKHRLASSLSLRHLHELHTRMLEDVLSAAVRVSGLSGICLVTMCPEISAMGRGFGALVLQEPAMDGHKNAVSLAARHLQSIGVDQMMTLPGDVPLVTSRDIETVFAAHGGRNTMTFVPDYCRQGSNCITLATDATPALRIGCGQFNSHIQSAQESGLETRVVENNNIAQDIDTPDDLLILYQRGRNTRAGSFLREIGVVREEHCLKDVTARSANNIRSLSA